MPNEVARPLAVLREEMGTRGQEDGNWERAHIEADALLIEAIRYLVTLLPEAERAVVADDAEGLIWAWGELEKWYV